MEAREEHRALIPQHNRPLQCHPTTPDGSVHVTLWYCYALQDAITRANLYADAGADATYVQGPISKQELSLIGQKVRGMKVMSNMEGSLSPFLTPAEAADVGFQIQIAPLSSIFAATK
jgi:2-methylisocitrate lyase-like PEP mutase family enzyme